MAILFFDEELVVQNLCREPHSSVTIRHFRKQKSCCHVIAIPQAGIAAPNLTVMQGFEAKKECSMHFLPCSCVLCLYFVFFYSTHLQPKRESNPGARVGS